MSPIAFALIYMIHINMHYFTNATCLMHTLDDHDCHVDKIFRQIVFGCRGPIHISRVTDPIVFFFFFFFWFMVMDPLEYGLRKRKIKFAHMYAYV